MLGYQAHREVLIWLETKEASRVELTYSIAGRPDTTRSLVHENPPRTPAGVQPLKFVLPMLEMGETYEYSISVDGERTGAPLQFRTRDQWEWRSPPPEYSFLFGSCAYLNDPRYDRPGKPYGAGTEIFRHMAKSGADFMLWGGDNLYLREADFSSESGIWYRYSHDRATPDLQPLWSAMHHYAVWDDHDYGSNNANLSFEFKKTTLQAFTTYWTNQTWGQPEHLGIYGKFYWGDSAFFLMDNRWYRDDERLDLQQNPSKSQFGERQREWLKQSLLLAQQLGHFTFKFIVTGSQVLTDYTGFADGLAHYEPERAELMKFIVDQKITGVIFLSGDVHFTELLRKKIGETQVAYELTSSPLSSGVSSHARTDRAQEPYRVAGTLVVDQNYCVLAASGPADARVLTITCFDKTNQQRWQHVIKAAELK